jgi:hypothetical protein
MLLSQRNSLLFQCCYLRGTRKYISKGKFYYYTSHNLIFYKSKDFQLLTQISTDFMQTGVFHFGKVFFLLFLNFDRIQ